MVYLQYFNQILTVLLEVLDDLDSSLRELAISLIVEMLKNQVPSSYSFCASLSYIRPFVITTCVMDVCLSRAFSGLTII